MTPADHIIVQSDHTHGGPDLLGVWGGATSAYRTYVANQTSAQFGQPTRFAGDFRQSEQRLFQIGARFEF